MTDKKEYSSIFNELLGSHVQWEKLSKSELVELATIFNNTEALIEKLETLTGDERFTRRRLRLVDAGVEFIETWDGPIVELIRKVAGIRRKNIRETNER